MKKTAKRKAASSSAEKYHQHYLLARKEVRKLKKDLKWYQDRVATLNTRLIQERSEHKRHDHRLDEIGEFLKRDNLYLVELPKDIDSTLDVGTWYKYSQYLNRLTWVPAPVAIQSMKRMIWRLRKRVSLLKKGYIAPKNRVRLSNDDIYSRVIEL